MNNNNYNNIVDVHSVSPALRHRTAFLIKVFPLVTNDQTVHSFILVANTSQTKQYKLVSNLSNSTTNRSKVVKDHLSQT